MTSLHPGFWQSLLRNRRGGVCAVSCMFVFFLVVTTGVWAYRMTRPGAPFDYPMGLVAAITALGGVKGWQYHRDGVEARTPPAAPPAA